jgi:hypothetical protein
MFHLFPRHHLTPARLAGEREQKLVGAKAVRSVAERPDFDSSDFEDSTPTIPGGYWHDGEELRDVGTCTDRVARGTVL